MTPGAKREAVAHASEHHGLSGRRVCALVGVSRRVVRYQSSAPDDALLRQRLQVVGLGFGRRDVAEGCEQAAIVEPSPAIQAWRIRQLGAL